jgi:ADP-heptose:LPS heptosyltransferase
MTDDPDSNREQRMRDRQLHVACLTVSALGDFLLAVPMIVAARSVYAGCSISVVCLRPEVAVFARECGVADRVVALRRNSRRSPIAMSAALLQARRLRADIVFQSVSSHGTFANMLAGATGAEVRCGFDRGRFRNMLTHLVPLRNDAHRITLNLDLLRRLGHHDIRDPDGRYLPPIEDMATEFSEPLRRDRFGDGYVVFSTGSSPNLSFKKWPDKNWAELARRLAADIGITCVFVGARSDAESIDRVLTMSGLSGVNVAGKTSFRDLAAIVAGSLAIVGTDGMVLHLAAAMGRPAVALFGPTDPGQVGPFGPSHEVVSLKLPCSPCYGDSAIGRGISCRTHECLNHLTVDLVHGSVLRLIESARHGRGEDAESERFKGLAAGAAKGPRERD